MIEDRAEYHRELKPEALAERERKPVPLRVLINPALMAIEGAPVEFHEGCLSVAGFAARVPRAREVRVHCLDRDGGPVCFDATGWYARIVQHEVDHLNGKLYLDRMDSRTFTTLENLKRNTK